MGILTNLSGGNLVDENGDPLTDDGFSSGNTMGPLVVSSNNSRYFAKPDGTCVYLQGSHTWNNLQDWVTSPLFDYDAYITFMAAQGSTHMRMWMWDTVQDNLFALSGNKYSPLVYARSGTAGAADGGNKFDLTAYNSTYFTQLRNRVIAAGNLGIYVSIMLFEGWSIYRAGASEPPSPWTYHPYKSNNNVNGIDGNPRNLNPSIGSGIDMHDLSNMPTGVLALQKAYVAHVIDTVNDLENVLYEISNESPHASDSWQQEIISYIQTYQGGLTNQHPVVRSIAWSNSTNASDYPAGLSSTAEMVAWGNDGPAETTADPLETDGSKVLLFDTDHVRPTTATIDVYTWKLFLCGYNVIHMDSADNITGGYGTGIPGYDEPMRRTMQQTGSYAARTDLRFAVPHADLSPDTGFCLANPGTQYLVLAPSGGTFAVDLSDSSDNFSVEWFQISDGTVTTPSDVAGGNASQGFTSPFSTNASVLFLNNIGGSTPGNEDRHPVRLKIRIRS